MGNLTFSEGFIWISQPTFAGPATSPPKTPPGASRHQEKVLFKRLFELDIALACQRLHLVEFNFDLSGKLRLRVADWVGPLRG